MPLNCQNEIELCEYIATSMSIPQGLNVHMEQLGPVVLQIREWPGGSEW